MFCSKEVECPFCNRFLYTLPCRKDNKITSVVLTACDAASSPTIARSFQIVQPSIDFNWRSTVSPLHFKHNYPIDAVSGDLLRVIPVIDFRKRRFASHTTHLKEIKCVIDTSNRPSLPSQDHIPQFTDKPPDGCTSSLAKHVVVVPKHINMISTSRRPNWLEEVSQNGEHLKIDKRPAPKYKVTRVYEESETTTDSDSDVDEKIAAAEESRRVVRPKTLILTSALRNSEESLFVQSSIGANGSKNKSIDSDSGSDDTLVRTEISQASSPTIPLSLSAWSIDDMDSFSQQKEGNYDNWQTPINPEIPCTFNTAPLPEHENTKPITNTRFISSPIIKTEELDEFVKVSPVRQRPGFKVYLPKASRQVHVDNRRNSTLPCFTHDMKIKEADNTHIASDSNQLLISKDRSAHIPLSTKDTSSAPISVCVEGRLEEETKPEKLSSNSKWNCYAHIRPITQTLNSHGSSFGSAHSSMRRAELIYNPVNNQTISEFQLEKSYSSSESTNKRTSLGRLSVASSTPTRDSSRVLPSLRHSLLKSSLLEPPIVFSNPIVNRDGKIVYPNDPSQAGSLFGIMTNYSPEQEIHEPYFSGPTSHSMPNNTKSKRFGESKSSRLQHPVSVNEKHSFNSYRMSSALSSESSTNYYGSLSGNKPRGDNREDWLLPGLTASLLRADSKGSSLRRNQTQFPNEQIADLDQLYDSLQLDDGDIMNRAERLDAIRSEEMSFAREHNIRHLSDLPTDPRILLADRMADDATQRRFRRSRRNSPPLPVRPQSSHLVWSSDVSVDGSCRNSGLQRPSSRYHTWSAKSSERRLGGDDMHLRHLETLDRQSSKKPIEEQVTFSGGVLSAETISERSSSSDQEMRTLSQQQNIENDFACRKILRDPEVISKQHRTRPTDFMGPPRKKDQFKENKHNWWPYVRPKVLRDIEQKKQLSQSKRDQTDSEDE